MGRIAYYLKRILLPQIILTTSVCFYFIIFDAFSEYLNFTEITVKTGKRQPHLLDNSCKFAWTEPFDTTLKKRLRYPKTPQCDRHNMEIFKRYSSTGEFILKNKKLSGELECEVKEVVGGLKPKSYEYKYGKRMEKIVPNSEDIFWINANNFMITCYNKTIIVFRKQFMGLQMTDSNELIIKGSFVFPNQSIESSKYSISMLVIDSTSRAQFLRHMKKTTELLMSLDSVIFEAYNKVGDNSGVNMLPILAEQLQETKNISEIDKTGDVNIYKILPSNIQLNPDTIDFIWKELNISEYKTMFNDDIMHTSRGLFHYPPYNFQPGFKQKPTNIYYRPYYNHIYNQLNNYWRKCYDGEVMAEIFIDSWFRFERIYGDVPHFGFNFISSLTHDDPNNLQILDDILFERIRFLKKSKSLQNTFLIIMGDHGNRIHPLNRYTFAGKIEERAPFLSIYAPITFRKKYPEKFEQLKENSQRNFDVHETLREILDIEKEGNRRGRSLFKYQDPNKTCQSNNVISNHCLCMIDASSDLKKVPKVAGLEGTLREYIYTQNLTNCFIPSSLECSNQTEIVMPNNYVQVWARTKISDDEIVYPYLKCDIDTKSMGKVGIVAQFRLVQDTQKSRIVYPPMINSIAQHNCSYYTFPQDYCDCLELYNKL